VLFGDVPAKEVSYVCPELLTCVAPPSGDDERSRTVDVRLVSAVSGRASRRPLPFHYRAQSAASSAAAAAAAAAGGRPGSGELIERLLASLERAQAAAAGGAAGAAGGAGGVGGGGGASAASHASVFHTVRS